MNLKVVKMFAAVSAAAVLLCNASAVSVCAKEIVDNGDFKYMISEDGKSAELISYVGQSLYVSVPPEVNNCTVTSVGAAAFKDNTKLKELEIPGTVKYIDTAAFSGCSSLAKVHISGSVKILGESAFSDCTSLEELSIDDGLQSIGKFAFSGCTSLEKAVLPNSVDSVGDYAFVNCTELSDPQIPKSLRYFGGYALENTKWMSQQKKNEFVTVGDGILIKYAGEAEVKSIPDTIKVVGSYAFAGNKKLKNVMIPSSVSVIQNSSFEGCEKLDNIYIPASVEKIGQRAFYGCTSLKKVDLTERLTVIENYCFSESGLQEVKIPKNVTAVNKGAFEDCASLSKLTIGDGVKKIGENAFKNCILLKRVVFPKNLSVIEKDAFAGCKNLMRVEFSGAVVLNENAFNECSNLDAAVFYSNPQKLDDTAFNQVPKLTIYSDNNLYLDEFAERNSKLSQSVRNLPAFNEYRVPDKDEDKQEFSSGYTMITILIIFIDLILIGSFAFYIVVIDRKLTIRKMDRELQGYDKTVSVKHKRKRRPAAAPKTQLQHREPPARRPVSRSSYEKQKEMDADKPIYRPTERPAVKPAPRPEHHSSDPSVTFATSASKKPRRAVQRPHSDDDVTYVEAPKRKTRPMQGRSLYESNAVLEHTRSGRSSSEGRKTSAENNTNKLRSGDTMIFNKPKK